MIGIVHRIHEHFVKQLTGSRDSTRNCTMAAGASALYRVTNGRKLVTAQKLRDLTGDHVGGNTLDQLRGALAKLGHGDDFGAVRRGLAIGTLYAYLRAGRGAVVQGSSIATRGTRWQGSTTFTGNHAWYVSRGVDFDSAGRPAYLIVFDPLADGRRAGIAKSPLKLPRNLFEKFLAYLDFGTERLGYGQAYALVTKVTTTHRHATSGGVYVRMKISVKPGYNVRSRPGGKVLRKTKAEAFDVWQKLSTGPSVGGSRVWYGDHSGTRWVHASARKA